jgi:hypothetical protein
MRFAAIVLIGVAASSAWAVEIEGRGGPYFDPVVPPIEVDVWTDRGERAVYYPGERIRVYFEVSRDAYVAVYDVDTEGKARLIFPVDPYSDGWVQSGTTYRLPPVGTAWDLTVSGPPGIDYVVAVASTEPFLWEEYVENVASGVFEIIITDPQLGIERINQLIAPLRNDAPYYVSDRTMFYVERRVPYPRYMCYGCHTPWYWDPYYDICPAFEIVIYSPYYEYYCAPPYNPWGRKPYYWYKQKTSGDYSRVRYKYKRGRSSFWDGRTKRLVTQTGEAKLKRWNDTGTQDRSKTRGIPDERRDSSDDQRRDRRQRGEDDDSGRSEFRYKEGERGTVSEDETERTSRTHTQTRPLYKDHRTKESSGDRGDSRTSQSPHMRERDQSAASPPQSGNGNSRSNHNSSRSSSQRRGN